jgi:hypothetical protein
MAEYNALGSEKLKGDDKLKRILELTYFNTNNKETSTNTKAEYIKESNNGGVYGIIKEKDGYYVKKGLNESSLEYIGGMFMKNKNKFKSYAEALKRLDLISGQETLNEEKKYVLKQNKPKEEASFVEPSLDAAPPVDSAPEPSMDTAPSDDMSSDVPSEEPSIDADSTSESKRSDYMAEIQKFAGKLGQELRDQHDKMESDDIKYVLNMIISAVNLDVLDPDDLDDIAKKFEPKEDESSDFTDEEIPDEEMPDDNLDETMDMLNDITNSSFDDEEIDFDGLEFEDTEELQEFDINSDLDGAPNYKPDYVSAKFLKYFADKSNQSNETDDLDEDETFGDETSFEDEDEIVEFDLESITKDINDNVVTTLKKYFK